MSHVLVLVVQNAGQGLDGSFSIMAIDGLAVIGTIGFFGPAAILLGLVAGAVVRDRRLVARENEEAEERGEPLG